MTQKEVALSAMKILDIYKPYIRKFEKDGTVTLFERFGGYYIDEYQEPELLKKIREFEEETGSLVYAVTHEMFWFGECYSFLIVSKYEEEWEITLEEIKEIQVKEALESAGWNIRVLYDNQTKEKKLKKIMKADKKREKKLKEQLTKVQNRSKRRMGLDIDEESSKKKKKKKNKKKSESD